MFFSLSIDNNFRWETKGYNFNFINKPYNYPVVLLCLELFLFTVRNIIYIVYV